jgi:hypothetical protein
MSGTGVNAQRVRENLKVAHFHIMGEIGRLSSKCDGFRVCVWLLLLKSGR